MPAIRTIGTVLRVIARAVRGTALGVAVLARLTSRGVLALRSRGAAGETGMTRLLDLHAASCAGDTLVAIGLAGTIFFTVPAGEARGQVGLYLLVTMLPFTVVAPVVGPVLDRFRHGRRYALATTMLGRAFLAYMISEHIGGFTLYPAAFGILVLSRAYGVARSAAVPRLLPAGLGLSEANARASVFGTLAGAVAAPIGIAAAVLGSEWSLRVASVVFILGMITALRLPPRADCDPPETLPRLLRAKGQKRRKTLTGQQVLSPLVGSASLRLLYGFLTLYLAFAIRSDQLPDRLLRWELPQAAALAVVTGGLGLGSFLATAVGTVLRIRRPTMLQASWLVLATIAAIVASAHPDLLTVTILCVVTAVASGLAKLAIDAAIQERVDEQVRASAFGHSETLLMVAWVAGGGLGLVPFPGRWGLIVATGLAAVSALRAVAAAVGLRRQPLGGTAAGQRTTAAGGTPQGSTAPATPAPRRRGSAPDKPRPGDPPPATPTGAPGDPGSTGDPGSPARRGRLSRRKKATSDTTRVADPDQPTATPARDPEPAEERPGFHLYRPSGFDTPEDPR